MLQQEKSAGNLNSSLNNNNLMHGGIPSTILPVKSKVVRSFTSSGNQSLEQIMKRANEIIKKSKNSAGQGGRPDITDILHPLTDSFVTLTTADSLQKNSQSTNREGCKVSPFVTVSSPENTESKKSNPHSSDKSSKAKSKISSGSAGQEDSTNLSARVNIAKQLHNNYMSEADYVFENFDSIFKVSFAPQPSSQQHGNHFAQKQSGPSQHTSFSANAKDNDNSCKISLTEVFERIRREEKSLQQQQNKQQGFNQNLPFQQNQANPIHLRSHSSIVNTNETSYLVPKQVQQTTSSYNSKAQQQQQQQQQPSIQQQLSSSFNQSSSLQTNYQIPSQYKDTNYTSSQSIPSNQQMSSQQQQIVNQEIETYLKKPQPAKIKTQSGAPLHPHPPLPQSTKMNINGYNTNHFNQQRFRYRNSLKDKENIQDAANTSIGQLNMSNGQIMTNPNKNGSFLCTPVAANHNNIPIPQQYQSIQSQQQQLQQSQNQHQHQRSSSNIADLSQYLNNNNNNNHQQNNASNSLQNSFGFYRPRFDSVSGANSNNNNNNMASERLNTIGIEQNIKTTGYASLKERTNGNNNNTQINDISCDKSANYSSMRVNTSYNGTLSQNQNQNNNNTTNQNSRSGSFQINIPKMTVGKHNAATSILNSLLGSQRVQQPQPTGNNSNTNQNSNNTSIAQVAYNPAASNSSQGNRSTSVPRSNLGFLLQKKQM
ncbi:hypothetical protein ABPG74_018362 [Tetrahymena malaccensis]